MSPLSRIDFKAGKIDQITTVSAITYLATKELSPEEMMQLSKTLEVAASEKRAATSKVLQLDLPPGYWAEDDGSPINRYRLFSPEAREGSTPYEYSLPNPLFITDVPEGLELRAWQHYAKVLRRIGEGQQ